MRYIAFFLIAFSFQFQVFGANDCRDVTLDHIDVGPNLTLLTFTYKENNRNQHEYTVRDFDRAASLLTVLNLHLNQEEVPVIEPSFVDLVQFLAKELISHYNKIIEELENNGDFLVDQILSGRISILNQLFTSNLSNRVLSNFVSDFLNHPSNRYFQHFYRVHYHTDHSRNTHRYESSQHIGNMPINVDSIDSVHDVIGYHLSHDCPIKGDLEELLFQHVSF